MAIKLITDNLLWDSFVDSSPFGTLFHKWDFLEIAARNTNFKLYRYGIFKGHKLVAVFPFFHGRLNIFRTLFSPPPHLLIPHLGFIVGEEFTTLKQNKKESTLEEIMFAINEINKLYPSDYLSISLVPGLMDLREFIWSGFRLSPYYTYSIPLDKEIEEIYDDFPKNTRAEIRSLKDCSSLIKSDDISDLIEREKDMYAKQGLKFPIHNIEYLIDVKNKYPSNINCYNYVSKDSVLSSVLMIEYKKAQTWIGLYRPEKDSNECFIWKIIELEKMNGYNELELIGANTKHLCKFKTHFNPTIQLYFKIEKENIFAKLAKYLKTIV